jgi:alkanesulfonate monooxygenase SsuD/methylene tetrahydromethanopterin reductase-like flavin-dependent oxidoreductase (luciferase family)
MKIGVLILPEHRWPEARGIWRRAEELGFAHAWTYDHVAWRALRDSAWFGAVPTLAAAAAVTERIRLGTLVASPNFRHPVPFMRDLLALDDVSGGRITLGVGAGGVGWDATVLGQAPWSPRERADRFAEFVDLLDRLLRDREVSYDGRFWSANEARSHPGCVQKPRIPFAVAATAPRGMRLVAKYGQAWVTTGPRGARLLPAAAGAKVIGAQLALLEEACSAQGRDARELDRIVLTGIDLDSGLASRDAFEETKGRYAEAGVTELVVHWPRPAEPFAGDLASFERLFA